MARKAKSKVTKLSDRDKKIRKESNKFVDRESVSIQNRNRAGRSDRERNEMGPVKKPKRSDGRPMPRKDAPPLYGPKEQLDYMNKPYFYGTKPKKTDVKKALKKK